MDAPLDTGQQVIAAALSSHPARGITIARTRQLGAGRPWPALFIEASIGDVGPRSLARPATGVPAGRRAATARTGSRPARPPPPRPRGPARPRARAARARRPAAQPALP